MANQGPVDLNSVNPQGEGAQVVLAGSGLEEKPFDPVKDREGVRGKIALSLVYCFVGIVIAIVGFGFLTTIACGLVACSADISALTSIRVVVELVITPLIGLVGAVSGFYFGEKSANAGRTP